VEQAGKRSRGVRVNFAHAERDLTAGAHESTRMNFPDARVPQ
jgi:hypothetical protein